MYNFLYGLILEPSECIFSNYIYVFGSTKQKIGDSYKHLKYILDHFVQNSDHKI